MTNEAREDAPDSQPEPQRPTAGAGVSLGGTPADATTREPVRARRCELRRTHGQYQLYMGDMNIQTFCSQFEDITRYAIPEGCSQQVRINIEPLGEVRELATQESEFREQGRRMLAGGAQVARERPPDLSEESLEEMEIELPDRGEPVSQDRQDAMHGLLRAQAETVSDFGQGPARPPRWRDELRERLERERTSLGMMLDFLARM